MRFTSISQVMLLAIVGLVTLSAATFVPRVPHSFQPKSFYSFPSMERAYGVYDLSFQGDDIAYGYLHGLVQSYALVDRSGNYNTGYMIIRNGDKMYFSVKNSAYSGGIKVKVSYSGQLRGVSRGADDPPVNGVTSLVARYTNDAEKAKACISGCGNCDDGSWTPATTAYNMCNAGLCDSDGANFVGPSNGEFRGTYYMVIDW